MPGAAGAALKAFADLGLDHLLHDPEDVRRTSGVETSWEQQGNTIREVIL